MALSQHTKEMTGRFSKETPEQTERRQEQTEKFNTFVKKHIPEAIGGLVGLTLPGLAGAALGGTVAGGIEGARESRKEDTNRAKGITLGAIEGIPLIGEGVKVIRAIKHGETPKEAIKDVLKGTAKDAAGVARKVLLD